MSQTARRARPISRWISCVRPDGLPSLTSRLIRSGELPGSIEYSAVTQPLPLPRIQRGTSSSTDAVQSTRVLPKLTRHDPADMAVKSRSNVIGRSSSGARPSARVAVMTPSWQAGRDLRPGDGGGVVELGAEELGAQGAEHLHVAGGQPASSGRAGGGGTGQV